MKARYLDKYMPEALAGEKRPARRTGAVMDRRDAERVPLHTYVSYVTDERMGLSRGARLAGGFIENRMQDRWAGSDAG